MTPVAVPAPTLSRPNRALLLLLTLASVGGCASVDVTPSGVPSAQRQYLLSPLAGYEGSLDPGARGRLEEAHRALVEERDVAEAIASARSLLTLDPALAPALVLAAQADFLGRRYAAVVSRLEPVLAELPTYSAGQLLLGRAAELERDADVAYQAYRSLAAGSSLAERRARAVEREARRTVQARLDDNLRSGHLGAAEVELALLLEWAPDAYETLDAKRRVAGAAADLELELEALRQLQTGFDIERSWRERLSRLELEVGDPRRGLEVAERLAVDYPGDAGVEELVAAAKFRWRLEMMPEDVRALTTLGELTRAEFATLLYWLVPNVRAAAGSSARIATDILGHERREAVLRVVNLGLMNVEDETLHRFAPDRAIRRVEALSSLLQIPLRFGERVACVRELALVADPSPGFVCNTAVRCALVPEAADCLLEASLSGEEARDLIRHVVALLGES